MEKIRQRTYKSMEKTIKINLGSGKNYIKGYINVDNGIMFPNAKVDVNTDIRNYDRENDSVDKILLSHVVMYFRPEDLEPLLVKWNGWLKKEGVIEIETINFDMLLDYAKQNDKSFGLDCIFGTESTKTHQWGWNITRLRDLVIKSGFKNIEISDGSKNPARDFKLIAIK